jgi:hypothetical protein
MVDVPTPHHFIILYTIMGQYISTFVDNKEKYDELETKFINLEKKYDRLKKSQQNYGEKIDNFVEKWYEENKEEVDIGQLDIIGLKVDLMPDELEKYIYKKCMKIMFSFMHSAVE